MADEYWRRGLSKVYWSATAVTTNPTAAQIAASVDLTPQIGGMEGFETAVERIAVENLASTFTPGLTGPQTIGNPRITFHDKKKPTPPTNATYDAIRVALVEGATGTLILCPYGTTTGSRVELWQAQSGGANDQWSLGNETAKYVVEFGITATPNKSAVTAA